MTARINDVHLSASHCRVPLDQELGIIHGAAEPGVMCYEDRKSSPRNLHWVDLSTSKPLQETNNVTHTKLTQLVDLKCVVNSTGRFAVVCSNDTVAVYDGKTDKLLWEFTGTLPFLEKPIRPTKVGSDGSVVVFYDEANFGFHQFEFSGEYILFVKSLLN